MVERLMEWIGVHRPEGGDSSMGVHVQTQLVGLDVGAWARLCGED